MRVCVGLVASVGWLSLARGFTTTSSLFGRTAVARYAGWDNDNFLDSLGKGAGDQEEANDEYFGVSRYGRPEEQQHQQRAPPGFGGRRSSGSSGPPSASQFAMEADDGYDESFAQQFTPQQQPSSMGQAPPTNQFAPPPAQGVPPPQAIPPAQVANTQEPGGSPPDQYAQQLALEQLSQQLAQLAQQQQQLLQNQQFSQQPPPSQQPVQQQPLGQPNAQAPAQNQQISMQQIVQQYQQQQQQLQQPPPPHPQQQQQPFQMGQDSSVDPAADGKDELPEGDIEGAVLTEEMKAKAKFSHTPQEEASQGGELFRSMMAQAKQRAGQQQTMVQQQPLPPPPPQQGVQIPANAMDLSIKEQARLFRDIMADRQRQVGQAASSPQNPYQQQQPQQWTDSSAYAQQQLPTYPYGENSQQPQFLPPGVGIDGRKIGRNRDADIIATSADVYFAQLKRDSSTRRLAREAGDTEKSNSVFHDPSIQEIKAPPANPYMVEQRAKERDMLESPPEEMLNFQEYNKDDAKKDRSYSGISFKEKLAQKRAQKNAERGDSSN